MKRLLPIGLTLLALSGATSGMAQTKATGVRDHAGMFSSETVQKANGVLRDLQRDGRWDIVVETFDSLDGQSSKDRAMTNVKRLDDRGLYILISKKEHRVEIEPTRAGERAFPKAENATLVKILVEAFKANEFDRGLLDAVSEIAKRATPATGVRDAAAMFSSEAVHKADLALKEIQKTSKWQVVIETVDSLGGKLAKDVAISKAKAMNINGLYILISKNDHKDEIEPSPSARSVFTHDRIQALQATILTNFKAKEFDRGLLATVEQIRKDLQPRTETAATKPLPVTAAPITAPVVPPPPVAASPKPSTSPVEAAKPASLPPVPVAAAGGGATASNFLPVLIVGGLGILVLLWLLSKAFGGGRQQAQAPPQGGWQNPQPGSRTAPYPPQRPVAPQAGYGPPPGPGYGPGYGAPPQQGGGGGFMSGLLGGAAGAVAGNILYDKFGRPHPDQGQPMPNPTHGSPPQHDYPSRSTDSADAGASGDWGGDDSQGAAVADNGSDDWGGNEPVADAGAGGDWGGEPEADAGAGGDWEGDAGADPGGADGAGGDWGGGDSSSPEPDQQGGW